MQNELFFRLATIDDLADIIKMLVDDKLGATREKFEDIISEKYISAFNKIIADPNQELTIVELNDNKVATFHLTFIQYLTHQGGLRVQIEAVRTSSDFRGKGIGKKVFEYAIERAKQKNCILLQLTTDKQRPDAIRFYKSIGFVATHEGMKLKL